MGLLSIRRFLMQPTKSRFLTGKSSGRLGTPPSNSGPVKSSDLQRTQTENQSESNWTSVSKISWFPPQRATEVKHQPLGVSDKFGGWPLQPPWPSQLPHTRSRREAAYTPGLWNTPHQTQRGFRRFNVTPKNKTPTESLDVYVVHIRRKNAWLKTRRDHSESLLEINNNRINHYTNISGEDLIRSDVLLLLKLHLQIIKELNHSNNKMHWERCALN